MVISLAHVKLDLPDLGAGAERCMEMEGIFEPATVELPDASRYGVAFAACSHIQAALESESAQPYFARPGLMVVSRVSYWIATLAANWAAGQDYFSHLNPIPYRLTPSKVAGLTFGVDSEEQVLADAGDRGYLENVDVEVEDGRHFKVAFMLLPRIAREIELDSMNGRPFFVEPGLIVISDFTRDTVRRAVEELARQGYFEHLKPSSAGVEQ